VVDGGDEKIPPARTGLEGQRSCSYRWLGLSTHTGTGDSGVDESGEHVAPIRKDSGRSACSESDEHMRSNRAGTRAINEIQEQRDPTGTNDDKSLKRPLALTCDTSRENRDFLTPFNWALRV
jgi:hypothetical protein